MADNVTADPGTGGATFKTDEDTGASAHVPVTKIELGANNSFDGYVAAGNPMPSEISDGTNTIAIAVEDAATPATINGIPVMMERDDALGGLTPIEGDWAGLRCSAEGALWTQEFNSDAILADTANIDTNVGTIAGAVAGTEMQVDIVAVTPDLMLGTDFSSVLGSTDLTTTAVLADGVATTQDVLNVRNFNYVYNGTTFDFVREGGTAGSILVDGSAVTQPVSGTVTANAGTGTFTVDNGGTFAVQAAVDELPAAAAAADNFANPTTTNIMSMGMVWDGATWDRAPGNSTAGLKVDLGADNDVTVSGTVLTDIETNTDYGAVVGNGAAATALRVTLANDSTGTAVVDLGANNDVTVQGENAHSGTTLGNPVLGGARATNSVEGVTQVTNADLTYVQADLNGVLLTRNGTTLEEILTERVSDSSGTSTNFTTFGAPGAGNHLYITSIAITNTNASTDGYVDFRDGSAGSVRWSMPAPSSGGSVMSFDPPLKFPDNTAVAYDVSAAIANVIICINGYTAQG